MRIDGGGDIELSALPIGSLIGSGGQGQVLELTGTDILCKRYRDPSGTNGEALAVLAAFRQRLPSADREFLDSVASWPLCRVTDRGRGVGFVMRRAPGEFSWRTPQATSKLLELQYLIRPAKVGYRTIPQPTPSERRALALACVRVVDWFHRRGMVVGDISHANVLWSLRPEPRVHFLDCDGFRPIDGVTVLAATDTPDWSDPLTPPSQHDFDSDAYKTALAVTRIITRDPYLVPGDRLEPVPASLDHYQEARVRKLFSNAAGARRTRPVLSEWIHALSDHGTEAEQPVRFQEESTDTKPVYLDPDDRPEELEPARPVAEPDPAEPPSPTEAPPASREVRDRKPINLRVSGR
ncbi:hypothetical protein [Streptomyces sp. NPDC027717]|uniref:hypothetical protein n=1 Tax=Streptomyces sp. NPDC027717 TaxID=3155765 RepID=UPI0033D94130